jgi:hypothetical protein
MDYPAPLVLAREDGSLDFSQAYDVGIGEWDVQSIRYAYSDFDAGAEAAGLQAIVQDGLDRGLVFLSDADARPAGAAQPRANLWDNGERAEEELLRLLDVRRIALRNFGISNIAVGRPLAELEEVLVPVYFMHRYQLDGAAKVLGGVDYRYVVRGDGQPLQRPIAAVRQRAALSALVRTLQPEELALTDSILQVLHPRPFGVDGSREQFHGNTSPTFDPVAAAQTLASLTAGDILQPQRCARLVNQHRLDPALPGLDTVLARLRQDVFDTGEREDPRLEELRRASQVAVVDALIGLAVDDEVSPAVAARVEWMLGDLRDRLQRGKARDNGGRAHQARLAAEIARFLDRSRAAEGWPAAPGAPPGSPIGDAGAARVPWALTGCSWGAR